MPDHVGEECVPLSDSALCTTFVDERDATECGA